MTWSGSKALVTVTALGLVPVPLTISLRFSLFQTALVTAKSSPVPSASAWVAGKRHTAAAPRMATQRRLCLVQTQGGDVDVRLFSAMILTVATLS
jgi:hypothetical protein